MIAESSLIYNLILPIPYADFRDFLDEVDELYRHAQESLKLKRAVELKGSTSTYTSSPLLIGYP